MRDATESAAGRQPSMGSLKAGLLVVLVLMALALTGAENAHAMPVAQFAGLGLGADASWAIADVPDSGARATDVDVAVANLLTLNPLHVSVDAFAPFDATRGVSARGSATATWTSPAQVTVHFDVTLFGDVPGGEPRKGGGAAFFGITDPPEFRGLNFRYDFIPDASGPIRVDWDIRTVDADTRLNVYLGGRVPMPGVGGDDRINIGSHVFSGLVAGEPFWVGADVSGANIGTCCGGAGFDQHWDATFRFTLPSATPLPVPEPGTIGLLGAGLVALGLARRRLARAR